MGNLIQSKAGCNVIVSIVTFKDLKERVYLQAAQQRSNLFERLRNKSFWIWDIEEHKQEDIKTIGDCCFNHIVGLSEKVGMPE